MANAYPKRPKGVFACKFVRLLTKKTVANDLGPQVFTLLAVVAHQEDARGYTDSVGWYNHQLMPLVGVNSVDVLDRVRRKAVEAGWLNYAPGGKGVPGRYFVTVPPQYAHTDDAPTDEGVESVCLRTDAETTAETTAEDSPNLRTDAEGTRRQQRKEPEDNSGTLIPVPFPVPKEDPPNPPQAGGACPKVKKQKRSAKADVAAPVAFPDTLDTPEFRAAWGEWVEYRSEIRKKLTPSTVAKQFKKLAALGDVATAIVWIETAIEKSWQSFYPPKDDKKPTAGTPVTSPGAAPQCRALTPFESQHMRYSPTTGAERDASGNLILDQLCRDLACAHCKPRRSTEAA